ncbi:uncharacterized protein MKK02DRAFT_41544 [Dioszegia hungarica]|uniref:Uncharacterized protein n=1 Tax=Dioszegia hungarica TaxID=4972 RepID=A0AA38H1J6_9TREE|nr:uncharacterized protein MKK02DRAFT_41544 [Dioszegia hungarica]KAI9631911.1 hypothetical protein MKK02DRAFT_41544 [Dioszegia hungarica]
MSGLGRNRPVTKLGYKKLPLLTEPAAPSGPLSDADIDTSCYNIPRRGTVPAPPPPSPLPTPKAPLNALSAAMMTKQTVEAKRQDALALKRRREAEAKPGYKDLASDIKKFKYTGLDPRDPDAVQNHIASPRAQQSTQRVPDRGIVKPEGRGGSSKPGWTVEKANTVQGMGGQDRWPPPTVMEEDDDQLADEDDEEKDTIFDSIISSNKKNNSTARTNYLDPTIKPFKSVQPTQPNSSAPASHQDRRSQPSSKFQLGPTSKRKQALPYSATATSSGSSARLVQTQPKPRPATTAKQGTKVPSKVLQAIDEDEYGDAVFDQLLASATEFDDGTSMYDDPELDRALEAALASGVDW